MINQRRYTPEELEEIALSLPSFEMPQEQVTEEEQPDHSQPPEDRNALQTVWSSVKRGVDNTQGLAYGAGASIAHLVGADGVRDWALKGYERNMEEADENRAEVGSYKNINSVGDAVTYALETLGELAPTIATIVLGGGIGGAAANYAGRKMVAGMIAKDIKKRVAAGATREVAEAAARASVERVGKMAGAWVAASQLEAGNMYGEDVKDFGVEGASPGRAQALGAVSGATDLVLGAEGMLLRSFAGKFGKGAAKNLDDALAKKLFKTALGEGGQEMLQEAIAIGHNALGEIENFGGNLSDVADRKGDQYADRLIESGIKGAIGGAGMGVGVHGLDKIHEGRQIEANKAAAQEDVNKLTAYDEAEYAQRLEAERQAMQQQQPAQQQEQVQATQQQPSSAAEQVSGQRTGINGPGGATDATPQAQPGTVTPPSQPVDQQPTQNQQTTAPMSDGVTRGQTELDSVMAQPLTDQVRQQLVERHEVAVNRLRTIGNELDPASKQQLIDEVNTLTYIVEGMGKVANGEPIARALQVGSPQEYQYQTPQQRQAEAETRSHAGAIDLNNQAAQTEQQLRHIEGERDARHARNQPVYPSQATDAYADEWAARQGVQQDTAQRRAGLDAQQQSEPNDLGAEVETMRSRNTQFLARLDQKKKAGQDVTADDVAATLGEVKRISKDETVSDEEWLGILTEVESTLPSSSRMKEWLSVLDKARQRVQAERETQARLDSQSDLTREIADTMAEAGAQVRAERDADLRKRANTDSAAWREYRDKKRAKDGVNQDMVDAEFEASVAASVESSREPSVKSQQRTSKPSAQTVKPQDTSDAQVKDNSDAQPKLSQSDIENAVSTIASQGVNKLTAVLDKIAAKKKADADKARQEAERVEEVRAKLGLDTKEADTPLPKRPTLYDDDDAVSTLTDPLSGYGSALDYDNTKADPVEEASGYINEDGDWVEGKRPTDGRRYSTKKPISTGNAAKDAQLDALRNEVGKREAKDPANIKKRTAGFEKRVKEVFGPKADYRKLKSGNMMVVTPNGAAILVRQQDALVTDMVGADGKPLEANGWWEDQATVLERHGIKLNRGGIMMLAKDRDAGTADHETMHAAMSLALTPLELKILRKRYMKDDMTEVDFDEAVAEAYQKWKPSERNGIFGKMHQFGGWLKETLFGYKPTDPDDVFKNVRKGKAWKQDGGRDTGTQRAGGIDKSSSRAIGRASEVNSDLQPIIDELIANGFLPNNNTDGVSNDQKGLSNRQGQSANRPQPNTGEDIHTGRGLHTYRARTLHDLRTRRSKGNDSLAEGEVSSTYRRGHTGLSVIHGTEIETIGWTANKDDVTVFKAFNYTAPDMFEMSGDKAARVFRNAIVRAKQANKYGAAVYVYDEADYKDMRLFISGDATAGFALKGTDIVSVFSAKKGSGVAVPLLHFAIQEGGRKLDAFDTILPDIYSIAGFKVVKRMSWNDEYAPDGWDKTTFKKFNGGEPDVVFMVYDPARADIYTPGEGEYTNNYEDAVKSQDDIIATLPATGYPAIKSSKDQTRYSLKGRAWKQDGGSKGGTGRKYSIVNSDGKNRWTRDMSAPLNLDINENSEGTPITDTDDQLANFNEWYSGAELVDPDGRPIVLYHGSKNDITELKPKYEDGLVFLAFDREWAGKWTYGTGGLRDRKVGKTYDLTPENEAKRKAEWKAYEEAQDWDYIRQENDKGNFKPYDDMRSNHPRYKDLSENWKHSAVYPVYANVKKIFDPRKDAEIIKSDPQRFNASQEMIDAGYFDSGNWLVYERKDVIDELKRMGYDAIILSESSSDMDFGTLAVFEGTGHIKSAIGNSGKFDGTSNDIRYSLKGGRKAGSTTKLYDSVFEANPDDTELLTRALGPSKGGVLERTVNTLKNLYQGDKESRQHFKESVFGILRGQTVDSFDRINVLGEMVDEVTGDNKGKLAYQTMRLSTTIDVAMSNMLQHGRLHFLFDEGDGVNRLTDESRGATNEGLIPLIEKLGDDLPNFLMHRVARRARKLHAEGRENNFTIKDIDKLDEIVGDASRFDEANDHFNRLQETIINYAIDSGTLSSDAKQHLDIIDYLPFYRVRETAFGDDAAMVGFTNTNNIISGIKKLKGGRDALDDPLTNILKNWSMIVTQAAKNNARTRVVDVMKEFGNEVIQPVTLAEAMADRSAAAINVMRDGKHEYYLVKDKALYDALITAPSVISDNAFMALGQKAKRWLTYGATFSPDFRVANFFRDTVQTMMLNKGYTPMDAVRGFMKAWNNHEDYIELRAHGGAFSHGFLYGTDPDNVHRYIEEVVVKDGKTNIVKHNAKKMLDWWARVGDAAENANRIGLYSKLKQDGISEMEAAYEAKDILDFSMRGGSQALQIATSLIPFLNARIAGLYKVRRGLLGKSLTDIKPEFYRTLGMLTSASLALAAWNASENEEEWDALQPHDKMDYYHFWAMGQHIRLPKPFEIGAIFSSLPEALMDAARKEDRKIIAEWFKHTFTNTFAVDWKAQVFKPAVEIWANKDSFTSNDIIPMGMEYLAPEMQYKENTKSIAKVIGNTLGVAPVHVEHVIKGYTASLGIMAMTAADIALEYLVDPVVGTELADKKPLNTNNIWGVGRFIRDDSIATSRYVSDFYDYARRVDEVAYTTRALQKDGDPKKLRDYIEENLELVQNKNLVNKLKKQFSNIRTRRLLINKSKTMTTERKAEELRKLVKMRNDLGRLFVEEMKRQSRYRDGRK